jgi:hypothetical protein
MGKLEGKRPRRLGAGASNGVGRGGVALGEAVAGCGVCRGEGKAEAQLIYE